MIRYRKLYEPIEEENELDNITQKLQREKNGFSPDSVKDFTKKFRYHYKRMSSYCRFPKPYCKTKSISNIQNKDDNYSFLRFTLAHIHKSYTS